MNYKTNKGTVLCSSHFNQRKRFDPSLDKVVALCTLKPCDHCFHKTLLIQAIMDKNGAPKHIAHQIAEVKTHEEILTHLNILGVNTQ